MENTEATTQYVSLANKYRPQKFEDMVGQESISKTLRNALTSGRIAHAYLFYGPRGCGKTTTARILAKALNCTGAGTDKPTAEPCGKCPQCVEIAQSADLDVLELDAASNTQVEKVREAIIDTVALASTRDRFKVFILDEVHMLSTSSFNALLKTIEEPPAHVVFILATTEKHKVPATIVSRCQTFRFRPITTEEITTHLLDLAGAENIDLTPAAAKIIAKNAGGAMRDALTLMDRAIAYSGNKIDEKLVGEMLGLTPDELIGNAVRALVQKDNAALHQVFDTLKVEGFDANSFLKDLKNALGDLFYFALGQGEEPFDGAKQVIEGVSAGFLAQLSRKTNKIIEEVKFSDNALISAEVGMFTVMDSCLDIEGFVRRLEALERGGGAVSSGPSVPPARQTPPVQKPVMRSAAASVLKAAAPEPSPKPAFAPAPAVEKMTSAAPQNDVPTLNAAISNRQIWDKMLKHFEKSPFVYDVMTNCSVTFGESEWTLGFSTGKEFYQIPAQNKLADLENAAKQISGRVIKFKLGTAPAETVASPAARCTPVRATKPAATKTDVADNIILDEEPFVNGNFAADIEPSSYTVAQDTPEELKEILEVIPGELLA
ncbi:MAG: DNA polymerase III subunit gamma/tau [Candidatus Avelusimicrobium sp.]|uniref:DNA polymerase III subunit gamma/tau n=1 Tax=Candidatus Avelusimicrobium sp. TaxID=3048833 RepID=UPI003F08D3A9